VDGAGSGAGGAAGVFTDAGASAVSAGAGDVAAGSSFLPQAVHATMGMSSASASVFMGPSC